MRQNKLAESLITDTGLEHATPLCSGCPRLGHERKCGQVAAHQLRKRYRVLLRQEIAQTVAQPGDVDDEIRSLISTLAVK